MAMQEKQGYTVRYGCCGFLMLILLSESEHSCCQKIDSRCYNNIAGTDNGDIADTANKADIVRIDYIVGTDPVADNTDYRIDYRTDYYTVGYQVGFQADWTAYHCWDYPAKLSLLSYMIYIMLKKTAEIHK